MNRFEPYLRILENSLKLIDRWRCSFGDDYGQSTEETQIERTSVIIRELQKKLEGNYPFHHPQYAGQMLKPPHPVAWLAYALTSTINPNNHALDGGPPTSEMEKEVIARLAVMVGYKKGWLGHLTSGGTVANLEALFVAREIHPGKKIAASQNAHYTHRRMCRVLNCDFLEIPVNVSGLPDIGFLEKHAGEIGTIVVTMGTTGLGAVEPLDKLTSFANEHGIRIHADAAYGGFFKLISGELPSGRDWDVLAKADSIVIDPHKHGLQPYGCGSVLYKDASVGTHFKHDSPYTYFTSEDLHLGEISLECSRAGAAAAAFWATTELLPLTKDGLGAILKKTRNAALRFSGLVEESSRFALYNKPELDISGYFKIPGGKKLSDLNRENSELFRRGMKSEKGFHLSLYKVPAKQFCTNFPDYKADRDHAVILRSVFMKEAHEEYVEELAARIGI